MHPGHLGIDLRRANHCSAQCRTCRDGAGVFPERGLNLSCLAGSLTGWSQLLTVGLPWLPVRIVPWLKLCLPVFHEAMQQRHARQAQDRGWFVRRRAVSGREACGDLLLLSHIVCPLIAPVGYGAMIGERALKKIRMILLKPSGFPNRLVRLEIRKRSPAAPGRPGS